MSLQAHHKKQSQQTSPTAYHAYPTQARVNGWQYVYEQQPEPTNVTGVPVTLTAIDPNGNTVPIGTTTSNAIGTYSVTWTPPIPGNYTIIATFAGSGAYYGSYADTYAIRRQPTSNSSTNTNTCNKRGNNIRRHDIHGYFNNSHSHRNSGSRVIIAQKTPIKHSTKKHFPLFLFLILQISYGILEAADRILIR